MFIIKKLLLPFILIVVVIVAFFALHEKKPVQKDGVRIGILSYLGTTEEELQNGFDNFRKIADSSGEKLDDDFVNSMISERRIIHFYDSIMALLMNFKNRKIDEAILPELVAKYIITINSTYEVKFVTSILSSSISFGFRENDIELRDEFNKVITEMKNDKTLDELQKEYILNHADFSRKSITPETFKDSQTIKIAVTGDMPPIDMFASDGKPTGYSTVILSEIGRRLKKNIVLVNVASGGRSAALRSGKVDVVFWYRTVEGNIENNEKLDDLLDDLFKDDTEGIILSIPYHSWEREIIMKMKQNF